MNDPRFEIFRDVDDEWRWRLRAANGQIVAASESYTSESDARRGISDLLVTVKESRGETITTKEPPSLETK